MVTLTVKKTRLGPVTGRHPWVFSQALREIPEGLEAGTPVRLEDNRGAFLATGYFNSYSQIAVRIWGYDPEEEPGPVFFLDRIRRALRLRKLYTETAGTDSYRLVHGENDLLPGLVVDKYADWLVVQFHTRGIARWRESIVAALVEVLKPLGIYERSDVTARRFEKLEEPLGPLYGDTPETVEIRENGFRFLVDLKGGQKTGFFLDQRDKRQALIKYARGRSVLNCFAYSGGFSVYALAGGAREVTSVDVSEPALELARENMRLNGLDTSRSEFIKADARKYLDKLEPGAFELIVLDPPAFIKSRKKKEEGLVGYRGINSAAMRALPAGKDGGGILLSCSCSAHLGLQEFRYLLSECGGHSRRSLFILEAHTNGTDHPSMVPYTEGDYLKCLFLSVE